MKIRTHLRRGSSQALIEAIDDRLRLYPDPMSTEFCRAVAELHGVEPDMVLAGNGSDDLLTILTRAFVGPGDLAAFSIPELLALFHVGRSSRTAGRWWCPYSGDWTSRKTPSARPRLEAFLPRQSR